MRTVFVPFAFLAACATDDEPMSYDEAISEAVARVGDAPVDGPLVVAHQEIQDQLFTTNPRTVGFDSDQVSDGYLGLAVLLPNMDLIVEIDLAEVDLAPGAHSIQFDLGNVYDFHGISVSNRAFDVPDDNVADVLSGQVPVRTACDRAEGTVPGRLLGAVGTFTLDGVVMDLPLHLSALTAGDAEISSDKEVEATAVAGIGIGVWSTDCKRADNCSAPDCSANILGVTVTGYCSWFETIFGVSCRCVIT